jgi:hypothetical protein
MVANHDAAKALKARHSQLRLFWIDTADPDQLPTFLLEHLPVSQHVAAMRPGSNQALLPVAKEVLGYDERSGDAQYQHLPPTSAWGLMAQVLGFRASGSNPTAPAPKAKEGSKGRNRK